MKVEILSHWEQLKGYFPSDLETSARVFGAFRRARGIPDAMTLLRLMMVYCATPLSFRQTVAWAKAQEIADISDVSLIERMERCEAWLLHLLQQMLPGSEKAMGRRVCLVDGTTVRASSGEYWRLQVVYNGQSQQLERLAMSDSRTAETLEAAVTVPSPDALYVADRGYARPGGVEALLEAHAHVLCRIKGREYLKHAKANQTVTVAVPKGRVFIIPIPEAKRAGVQKRLRARAVRKGQKLQPETIESNQYWFLFCSDETISVDQAVEIYRWRWQVELLFKRLKSLQDLDEMSVRSPVLCRVYLLCHALLALVAQRIHSHLAGSFSPEAIQAGLSLACLAIPLPLDTASTSPLAVPGSA